MNGLYYVLFNVILDICLTFFFILITKYFDKKTKYSKHEFLPFKLFLLFSLFPIICIFNIKRIKKYRENKYKNKLIKEMLIYRPDCDELKMLLREQKIKKIEKH